MKKDTIGHQLIGAGSLYGILRLNDLLWGPMDYPIVGVIIGGMVVVLGIIVLFAPEDE